MVNTYGFRQGVAGLNIGASKMTNFGIDAKQALRNVVKEFIVFFMAKWPFYVESDIENCNTCELLLPE